MCAREALLSPCQLQLISIHAATLCSDLILPRQKLHFFRVSFSGGMFPVVGRNIIPNWVEDGKQSATIALGKDSFTHRWRHHPLYETFIIQPSDILPSLAGLLGESL